MLDPIKENIIEITMVYCRLAASNQIIVEDSLDAKHLICKLANDFEIICRKADSYDFDYYLEIEKFAKEKLLNDFGIV